VQTLRKQRDVEDQPAILRLGFCQQVKQQRPDPGLLQHARNVSVSFTEATAAAAVGEQHEPRSGSESQTGLGWCSPSNTAARDG
jgi:hypothetical protein